jgi:hypothetical protein
LETWFNAPSGIVGNTKFTAVFDKGYHKGSELKNAQELGVKTLVAIPDISSASMAPDPAYNVSEFVYNKKKIHTPVRRNKYLLPTETGTQKEQHQQQKKKRHYIPSTAL